MLNHRVEEFEQARFEHAETMQEATAKHRQQIMDTKQTFREELEAVQAALAATKLEASTVRAFVDWTSVVD